MSVMESSVDKSHIIKRITLIPTFLVLHVYDGVLCRWPFQQSLGQPAATGLQGPDKGHVEHLEDVFIPSQLLQRPGRLVVHSFLLQKVAWLQLGCSVDCLGRLVCFLSHHLHSNSESLFPKSPLKQLDNTLKYSGNALH